MLSLAPPPVFPKEEEPKLATLLEGLSAVLASEEKALCLPKKALFDEKEEEEVELEE